MVKQLKKQAKKQAQPKKQTPAIPEPRIRLSDLKDIKALLKKTRPEILRPVKKIRLRRFRHVYSDKQRLLVVLLRYNSLTDFSQPRYTFPVISEYTGIHK